MASNANDHKIGELLLINTAMGWILASDALWSNWTADEFQETFEDRRADLMACRREWPEDTFEIRIRDRSGTTTLNW